MNTKKTVKFGVGSLALVLALAAGTSVASAHPAAVAGWIVGGAALALVLSNANNGYYNSGYYNNYYPYYDYGYSTPYYGGYSSNTYNNGYSGYGYSYPSYSGYSGYWY